MDRVDWWLRSRWEEVTGVHGLRLDLPDYRPGCGSWSVEPGMAEELAIRFGDDRLHARAIVLGPRDDKIETCCERGRTDGLLVVPPTPIRVLHMLSGTRREPDAVIAIVSPNLEPCTVEKATIKVAVPRATALIWHGRES